MIQPSDPRIEAAARIAENCFPNIIRLGGEEGIKILLTTALKETGADEMAEAMTDILEYSGWADSALDDPYVMERARAALAKYRALKGEG